MKNILIISVLLCPVGPAFGQRDRPADPWQPEASVRDLAAAARAIPRSSPEAFSPRLAPATCGVPAPGPDPRKDEDCEPAIDLSCGMWGVLCAGRLPDTPPLQTAGSVPPINTGFRSMGPAGSEGRIDGPGKKGNGRFTILVNSAHEISMEVRTGYIDGSVTLMRDPGTGKDTMRFLGKKFEDGEWGPLQDKTSDIVLRYNPKKDEGSINWQEDGQWKSERFWAGGDDDKDMVIEFGGGWDHDFFRD